MYKTYLFSFLIFSLIDSASEYEVARRLLGDKAVIGVSVNSFPDIDSVATADYVSVKVFASPKTSPGSQDHLWGLDGLEDVRRQYEDLNIVAVGGITASIAREICPIIGHNGGIAMAGTLMRAQDPYWVASSLSTLCHQAREGYYE